MKVKEDLDHHTALFHVDYSESYKNKQQDEIQSAYFGQNSFSIFTASVYYKDSEEVVKKPMTIISESSDHSRIASMSCINMLIEEVEKVMALKKAIFWSDGCGAQFRSRFIFKILASYRKDLKLEWHFNEAHHGKGPMDGIGGTIKNVVYRNVKCGKVLVNSAQEFCNAANKLVPSITSLFQTDLMDEPDDIEAAPKIPETLKIHRWSRDVSANGDIKYRFFYLSSDSTPFFTQAYHKVLKCGHAEREFESLMMMKKTCAGCAATFHEEHEKEDWVKCSICLQWFHESCFRILQ